MGKITGFLEFERNDRDYAPVEERVKGYREFVIPLGDEETRNQAARCMDCGVPYCHGTNRITGAPTGCPVNNQIPDWNDLVYRDQWRAASDNLHSTNNFPEFTGRVCPAPCEASCVLNIDDNPVSIKTIECEIVDRAFEEGWIKGHLVPHGTGKRIAVVGSGPAGLACAQQLARAGHSPTVFEKSDRLGGLLRYGIPDFKMEKHLIDRRVKQMEKEGVIFRTEMNIGVDVPLSRLLDDYAVLVMAGGAEKPRDLEVPGRELDGIHFAMDFLTQQNKRVAGDSEKIAAPRGTISAAGKHVVVIGGGDTGSDCIGTSIRQGAKSVTQLEIMPKPPVKENKALTWPNWPMKLRISSSQAEGAKTEFSVQTTGFSGENGRVKKLHYTHVDGKMQPIAGSDATLDADLVLFAMGFSGPVENDIVKELGLAVVPRGRFKGLDATEKDYKLAASPKLFAAGDIRRGQSLVVWAIREGRQAARAVDEFLMGASTLPR